MILSREEIEQQIATIRQCRASAAAYPDDVVEGIWQADEARLRDLEAQLAAMDLADPDR